MELDDYTPLVKLCLQLIFFLLFLTLIFIWTRKFSRTYNIKSLAKVLALTIIGLITTEPLRIIYSYASELFSNFLFVVNNTLSDELFESVEYEHIFARVNGFHIVEILIFYLSFLLVAYTISLLTRPVPDDDLKGREKKDILLKNFTTITVIIISIYLSLVAIVSVPIIETISYDKEETLVKELQNNLRIYKRVDSIQRNRHLQDLRIKYENIYSQISDRNPENAIAMQRKVQAYYLTQKENIYKGYRTIDVTEKKAVELLRNTRAKPLSPEIRYIFKEQLANWYENVRETTNFDIEDEVGKLVIEFSDTKIALDSKQDSTKIVGHVYYPKYRSYDLISNSPPIPNKLGSNLSFFSIFAGWLMNTGNTQLALIIGLIGFGLLGSIVATFLKEEPKIEMTSLGKDLVLHDVIGFIIRGFAAALVIFLAIKGSVGILTKGDTQLNLYMTFFLCFTASVYSDLSWEWARDQYLSKLKGKPSKVEVNDESDESDESDEMGEKKPHVPITDDDIFDSIDFNNSFAHDSTYLDETIFEILDKKLNDDS